jgi:hypothetical protein
MILSSLSIGNVIESVNFERDCIFFYQFLIDKCLIGMFFVDAFLWGEVESS